MRRTYWYGKMPYYTERLMDELVRLRDAGAVKAPAVSIYDRKRAGELAVNSPLDAGATRSPRG